LSTTAKGIVSPRAAELALWVFTRVAEAEAKVHGVTPEEVHFHEVGAADSIIDILFSSYLLDLLQPTAIYATPLALGSGTVICDHGELPVPAPATVEILAATRGMSKVDSMPKGEPIGDGLSGMPKGDPKGAPKGDGSSSTLSPGVPSYASSHSGELTTPTGAALIAEFVTSFAPLPCSRPLAIGYGAGSREIFGAANVLRAISAEPGSLAGLEAREEEQVSIEGITQLECNLDHISAEAVALACEELLAAGALDVWQEPITMKKGRLAIKLVVLTKPQLATTLAQRAIELTGSLGVRANYLERTVIPRAVVILDTPYGPLPFKAAEIGSPTSRISWLRPEHDAVARLAHERGLDYLPLYLELQEFAATECGRRTQELQ